MSNELNNLYEFGEFRLDTKERFLFRGEETVFLAPKVFDTLEFLVARNGKVVSKNELLDEVWADSYVEESNLTQNIYVLRKTLGKEFIETIPRRGYRFAADVKTVSIAEKAESYNSSNGAGEVVLAQRTRTQIIEEEIIEDSVERLQLTSPKLNKFRLGLAFASIAVLIASIFGYWIWNKNSSDNINNTEIGEKQIEKLTDSGNITSLAISPDGKLIAYTISENGNEKSLYLKDLNLNKAVKVATSEHLSPTYGKVNPGFLKFSPDGNHVLFLNKTKKRNLSNIFKTTKFGGEPELVAEGVTSEFSFSKDGKRIVFVRADIETNDHSLIIKNLETSEETTLTKRTAPEGYSLISAPIWSSDEGKIYVVTRKQKLHFTELVSVDIETQKEELIPTPKWLKVIVHLTKAPNKEELILAARRNGRLSQVFKLDLNTNKIQSITNDLNNYRKISISDDGKKLAVVQFTNRSELKLLSNGETENVQDLTSNSFGRAGRHGLDVMQDGRILYVSLASRNREIWLLDTNDNSKRQLTKNKVHPSQNPTTALNGRYIYYVSVLKNTRNIKRMDLDGRNQIELIAEKNSNDILPAVSPNDETLYFIRNRKGVSELWKKNLPDGKPEKLEVPKGLIPNGFLRISPDGNYLAFRQMEKVAIDAENRQGKITVGVISLKDLSAAPKLFKLNVNFQTVRWTPTSEAFDYVETTKAGSTIKRQAIAGESPPQIVKDYPRISIHDFVWMPNSEDLLISERFAENDGILITNFD